MNKAVNTSVVIPVYNSADCIEELINRLVDVLDDIENKYEIILINDYSKDSSWEKIVECCNENNNIIGINFRKNFGQDNAIMAGLKYSSGKSIIIMDDDLQHDPMDIPSLLDKLNKGSDVVYANFLSKKQSLIKNIGSWFNGKIANIIINKPKEIYLSPFKAINRSIIIEILKYNGPYPYIDGLIFRVTRNINQISIQHHKRFSGKGNYGLIKSIGVWLKLATNFSVLPLRISTTLGFLSSGVGFVVGSVFIIQQLIYNNAPAGWASNVVIVLFIGGIQLISLGLIGEYVGRLFLHHSEEPQFTIYEIIEKK